VKAHYMKKNMSKYVRIKKNQSRDYYLKNLLLDGYCNKFTYTITGIRNLNLSKDIGNRLTIGVIRGLYIQEKHDRSIKLTRKK
jgi:hypothetical protein